MQIKNWGLKRLIGSWLQVVELGFISKLALLQNPSWNHNAPLRIKLPERRPEPFVNRQMSGPGSQIFLGVGRATSRLGSSGTESCALPASELGSKRLLRPWTHFLESLRSSREIRPQVRQWQCAYLRPQQDMSLFESTDLAKLPLHTHKYIWAFSTETPLDTQQGGMGPWNSPDFGHPTGRGKGSCILG